MLVIDMSILEGTMEKDISQKFICNICELYNDRYDDRMENTCPPTAGSSPCIPGENLASGQWAEPQIPASFSAGTAGEWDISSYIEDQEDPYHRRLLGKSVQQEDPRAVFQLHF